MRTTEAELKRREERRNKILIFVCPDCGAWLCRQGDMEQRNPKFMWFKCTGCHQTLGVSKRQK